MMELGEVGVGFNIKALLRVNLRKCSLDENLSETLT
jgi:hypothetical protein